MGMAEPYYTRLRLNVGKITLKLAVFRILQRLFHLLNTCYAFFCSPGPSGRSTCWLI